MLERLAQGATGADLQRRHVDVGAERGIGIRKLAADPVERGLHAEPRVRAHDQQIHEVRESGPVLVLARADPTLHVEIRHEIPGEPAAPNQKPDVAAHVGDKCRHRRQDRDREHESARDTGEKEHGGGARTEKGGLAEPALAPALSCATPAARRRTPRRTCSVAMMPKATVAAARKTSRLRIRLSPTTSSSRSNAASMVQILKFTMRYITKSPIPIHRQASPSPILVTFWSQMLP